MSDQSSNPQLATANAPLTQPQRFNLSPLIRITLLLFYVALTVPLPFLAGVTQAPVPPWLLAIGLVIGGVLLYAALTERVLVDDRTIQVTYPTWVPAIWRKGWTLSWEDIAALKPRTTGQGGLVYYFVTKAGEARLLPMRIAGFAQLVRIVEAKTGIDTRDVRPLAQPWMYFILLGITLLLLLVDGWTVWTAVNLQAL
ncbi:hypothetical protein ACQ4M4_17135 [Leptolyngbya sp. AN02str]|uniref:hypothetical protein n=1 Tax=Leptolyngbya sp. AN02str TaxID=3423363 RepID=UPI003D3113F9